MNYNNIIDVLGGGDSMSNEKVFHIGVMIGNVHTQHPMELIRGISEAAKTENVNISFFVGAQGNALDFWKGDDDDFNSYNYQYNSLYDYGLGFPHCISPRDCPMWW